MAKRKGKVEKVMHEWGQGKLHSGSKHGPKVTSQKQAVAIALSEARAAGEDVPKKAKRRVHHSPEMTEINRHLQHSCDGEAVEHGKRA